MDDASALHTYDAARFKRAGRGRIYDSVVDTIGDTPLVRLPRLSAAEQPAGEVLAKLEFLLTRPARSRTASAPP
jgi:cysteine synthase A